MVSKMSETAAKACITKKIGLPKDQLRNLLKQEGISCGKKSNAKTTSPNGKKKKKGPKKVLGSVLSSTLTENKTSSKNDKKSEAETMSADVKKKQNFSKEVLKNMISSALTENKTNNKSDEKSDAKTVSSEAKKKQNFSKEVLKNILTENTTTKKKDAKSSVTKVVPKSGGKKKKSGKKDQTLKTPEATSHNEQSDVTKTDSKVNESVAKSDVAKNTPVQKNSKKSKKQGTLQDKQSDVTETAPKMTKTADESDVTNKKSTKTNKRSKRKSQDEQRTADSDVGNGGSILVRNLGTKKRSVLQTYFEQYGKVKSVKFIKFGWANVKTKKTKKTSDNEAAVVYFINDASAKKALAADKKKFKDKEMRVSLYSEKPTLSWKRSVIIKNISKDLQEEDIRNKFDACGMINSVEIVSDGQEDSNTVNAVLNFKTPEAVKVALKWKGKNIFGEESLSIERHQPERPTPNKQKPKPKKKKMPETPQNTSGSSQKISVNDDGNWMQEVLEGAEQDYIASQRKHLVFDNEENSNSLEVNNRRFGSENTWMNRDQRSSNNFKYSAGGDSYDNQNRNRSFNGSGQAFSTNQGRHTVFDKEETTNSARSNNRTFRPNNQWEGRDQRFSGNSYGDQSRKRRWDDQDSGFSANQGMQRMNNDMNFQNQSTSASKPKLHIVFDD